MTEVTTGQTVQPFLWCSVDEANHTALTPLTNGVVAALTRVQFVSVQTLTVLIAVALD